MSDFQGRVAVVTGAGSGIGRALGLGLARRGARLALGDIEEDGLAETARRARDLGAEVFTQRVDVSERDAVGEFAARVSAHFDVVNQVYNNAGIVHSASVAASAFEDYERVFAVNLWGVIHGTKAFLPHLIASGDGHVVNISSLNGFMAMPGLSHYCATKFAVRGFTETLRIEMLAENHPVHVTCVHPGGVRTSIGESAIARAREAGRVVTDEEENLQRRFTDLVLRMSPDRAAALILKGVERNKGRVLVGTDAKVIDTIVRTFPAGYVRTLGVLSRRVARRIGAARQAG